MAAEVLEACGFVEVRRGPALRGTGLAVSLVGRDRDRHEWSFDVSGSFSLVSNGLTRTGAAWEARGRASVLSGSGARPLVLLTTHLPTRGEAAGKVLRAGPATFFDAVELLDPAGQGRLRAYAAGGRQDRALPGFWSPSEAEGRSAGNP